jgi:predicted kinase
MRPDRVVNVEPGRAPVLVLLNGAPASGKSTLAGRWADAAPGRVVVDVDVVRAMIGGWRDDPTASGLLARRMALAAIGEALDAGRDVIVPQFLAAPEFWDALAGAADAAGAGFLAVVLEADARDLAERFAARSAAGERTEHADAAWLQAAAGEDVADQQSRVLALAATRPGTVRIRTRAGDVDAALAELAAAVAAR